jgi:NAD(P)-dependent dehydrogenase (short-subunit alcohol dehydrogenase family)
MTYLKGGVAVVTGGASGLGAATARALADAGMRVAIFDLAEREGAALATNLNGLFCKVDVSDPESVAAGFAVLPSALGLLRAVVNCAGIGPVAKTVSRGAAHDPAQFMKAISVNLGGHSIAPRKGLRSWRRKTR